MTVRLGGDDGMLQLPEGAAYIFTTAGKLTVEHVVSGRFTIRTPAV